MKIGGNTNGGRTIVGFDELADGFGAPVGDFAFVAGGGGSAIGFGAIVDVVSLSNVGAGIGFGSRGGRGAAGGSASGFEIGTERGDVGPRNANNATVSAETIASAPSTRARPLR